MTGSVNSPKSSIQSTSFHSEIISSSDWNTTWLGGKERKIVKYTLQDNSFKVTLEKFSISLWDRILSFFFKNYKVTEKSSIKELGTFSSEDEIHDKLQKFPFESAITNVFKKVFKSPSEREVESAAPKTQISQDLPPKLEEIPPPTVLSPAPTIETIEEVKAEVVDTVPETALITPKMEQGIERAIKVQNTTRGVWGTIAFVGSLLAVTIASLRQGGQVAVISQPVSGVIPHTQPGTIPSTTHIPPLTNREFLRIQPDVPESVNSEQPLVRAHPLTTPSSYNYLTACHIADYVKDNSTFADFETVPASSKVTPPSTSTNPEHLEIETSAPKEPTNIVPTSARTTFQPTSSSLPSTEEDPPHKTSQSASWSTRFWVLAGSAVSVVLGSGFHLMRRKGNKDERSVRVMHEPSTTSPVNDSPIKPSSPPEHAPASSSLATDAKKQLPKSQERNKMLHLQVLLPFPQPPLRYLQSP